MLSLLLGSVALGLSATSELEEVRSWSSLDAELASLSASLQAPQSGIVLDGYLRTFAAQVSDAPAFAGQPNDDVMGVVLDRARLGMNGSSGEYSFRIELEAAGGDARILDAYGAWQCNEHLRTTMGRFQTPLYWNGLVDPRYQLFVLRTVSDEFWIGGDPARLDDEIGLMLDGAMGRLKWWLAAQNGADGIGDELAFTGRLRFDVLGQGVGMTEGSYGAPDDAALSVGVGWHDDGGALDGGGNSADGDVLAADAQYANGAWALNAEFLDYSAGSVNVFATPDSQPWAVAISYMIQPNTWEVAARYQDVDTSSNLTDITLGVNYYANGHNAKWQFNVINLSSDASSEETTALALALTVGV